MRMEQEERNHGIVDAQLDDEGFSAFIADLGDAEEAAPPDRLLEPSRNAAKQLGATRDRGALNLIGTCGTAVVDAGACEQDTAPFSEAPANDNPHPGTKQIRLREKNRRNQAAYRARCRVLLCDVWRAMSS
jgi:hypothetical protein